MGFFNRLTRVSNAINRDYTKWRRRFWVSLTLIIVLSFGYSLWRAIWGPPTGGVTLIIHNELDRPILGFSVNGMAGPNAFAHGGGKTSCCGSINGRTAEVIWTLSTTRAQYDAGIRKEVRKIIMPLPERKKGENDLHVHFFPGDKVLLGWSDNAWSPYEKHYRRNVKNIYLEK